MFKRTLLKKIFFFLILIAQTLYVKGQQDYVFSQFTEYLPLSNPSYTGINSFTDIKMSHRLQWVGVEGAPTTSFIGFNTSFNKEIASSYKQFSLRISAPYLYDSLTKVTVTRTDLIRHGLGAYVVVDNQGPLRKSEGFINYSIHLPLKLKGPRLAVGVSVGGSNERIDPTKITLRDPENDEYYQWLIASGNNISSLEVNSGFSLYNDKYHLGYGVKKAYSYLFADESYSTPEIPMFHYITAGLSLYLSDLILFKPSVLYHTDMKEFNYFNVEAKMVFSRKIWTGVSYRSTGMLTGIVGMYMNNKFNLSYSYDMSINQKSNFGAGSHELVIGIMFLRKDNKLPFL